MLPPAGFLRAARELADERNVLLILDEIQSGLGRTGEWFAYMHEGIRPDGVIVGKALGGGLLPVSAFVAINSVMDLLEPGSHGSTFGGNPLAARVGREALAVIEEEQLVERSRELGEHLLKRLRALSSPLIRAVRGRGLWVGVELDSSVSARKVAERMAARGVLTKDTHETVIRFAPPLTISREALDWGIDVFVSVLSEFGSHVPKDSDRVKPVSAIATADGSPDDERARAFRGELHDQPLDAAIAVVGVTQEACRRCKARLESAEEDL